MTCAELLQENARLKEAYERAQRTSETYAHIAQALARDYTDLFHVNLDTNEFIEYRAEDKTGALVERRHDTDFFESCKRDASLYVHPEDRAAFVRAMNREFLTKALRDSRMFELTFRKVTDGRSFYVQLKASRIENDCHTVIVAISDIDELVTKRRSEAKIHEERVVYARLHALTGNTIVVYVVNPETDRYREFSSTDDDGLAQTITPEKEGMSFFETYRDMSRRHVHPADLSRFLAVFTKTNIMAKIEQGGIFTLGYRLVMGGKPVHVQMKAAMVEEDEGPRLIVSLTDIDAQVRQEEEVERRLAQAQSQAKTDALTGVRNRHAYLEAEARMDHQIAENESTAFAILMMDVNELKKINDTAGHQAGDQYLRDACKIICETFKHSPVFRVGGDEFAVIAQGGDYANLDERLEAMRKRNAEALRTGSVVIACGVARYDGDTCVAEVLERADRNMYENKSRQKAARC